MPNHSLVVAGLALGACTFSSALPTEVAPTITVGFEQMASDADEKSSVHEIRVVLSEVSDRNVTVKYQVADTTAQPDDFTLPTPETIIIPAGQLSALLAVEVKADTIDPEPDETIDFVLLEPDGAELAFGAERHRVTILAKALPRIGFSTAMSMAQEPTDETLTITLDEPSVFPITVQYAATSTTATSGNDYVLADGMVTFAPNETSKQVVLDVLDDQLDENDETVTVTLSNPTNAFVDMTKADHVHTILDTLVDPPPDIEFATATSQYAESGAMQNIVVTLSELSGRDVQVSYAIDAMMSNAGSADITVSGNMVTIPAGQMTANISVEILQDTLDEPTETVELDLATPVNATLGTITTHRLSITDDDLVCYGPPNSAGDVCFQDPPTGTVNLPGGTVNTDTDPLCSMLTIDFGPGQDPACFIAGATINVNGATTFVGTRRVVFVATTALNVSNIVDVSSTQAGRIGPGANSNECDSGTNPQNDQNGGGGGAGGSFMGRGANGGSGDNGDADGGISAVQEMTFPLKLRGGCAGQKGGNGGGGAGGNGGGAVYFVSGGTMTFSNAAVVNASGAGGSGGDTNDGGGGGGSGGMIAIYATGTLMTNNSTKLVANGGGGGSGGTNGTAGAAGSDPVPQTETTQASGGTGAGVDGGAGFAGGTAPVVGDNGNGNEAGGGGGGGGGYIYSNKLLGNADTSAFVILIVP